MWPKQEFESDMAGKKLNTLEKTIFSVILEVLFLNLSFQSTNIPLHQTKSYNSQNQQYPLLLVIKISICFL
jgi:hypothetical protein